MQIPGFEIEEVIHESSPRIIYAARRLEDGARVALKTLAQRYPTKQDVAEIRREFGIAERLAELDGVIRVHELLAHGEGNLAIVMERFGRSLAELLVERGGRGLRPAEFLPLAIRVAQILGEVHEQEIVHKDIVPRNILIDDDGELRLIDFGISSELSQERQDLAISRRLEGSLPYISPEQTGRMNRVLDYRSDYYSLGATFFELLTGQLPFSADNVLEWVHRHISQQPPSPRMVDTAIPEPLSQIVLKLLAKNAEDRYQSTYGLIADLQRCQRELDETGWVQPFELATDDVSRRFQLPQKLYGRDAELDALRAAFARVDAGATELCLVSGYSGIGKSALVNELSNAIARERGYLIQGKFDQYQQRSAYSAISDAFGGLVRQLLAEPPARLEAWRAALSEALGNNAQVIVELVPSLALIIGEQPPATELPATEAQNRLQLVFQSFVKVFAAAEHPLVVFIDDLQWSDPPTLALIARLVSAREISHLLLIGAYRENEVDAAHPLTLTLDELRKVKPPNELSLAPLSTAAIDQLAADALRATRGSDAGGDDAALSELSALLYQKSAGNPFVVNALLESLHAEGAIRFVPERGRWRWDLEAVRRADVGDNVVEFMVGNLRKLPSATQRMLQLAACIGNVFDLRSLSVIAERSRQETADGLLGALKRNLVSPLDESYKFAATETANPRYRFQHDRVQQAAYALIDADRKQEVHLSIGRLIEANASEAERAERLIDIVSHLDLGRALIDDPVERRRLAELNLSAGLQAHGSSSYAAARSFLEVARELLPEDAWERDYELTLAIESEYQQCAYLTGAYDEAEVCFEALRARARTPLEKAEVLATRTRQYSTMGKMQESIEAAIAGLALLGVEFPQDPDQAAIEAEAAEVTRLLGGREIAELVHAAPLTDPKARVAIRLLMEIFPAAFLSGSGNLFPFLVLKAVTISLAYGTGSESAFAYAAYGMLLCGALEDPALGYEYGKLAVRMNEELDDIKLESRVIYVYTMFIHHWSNHYSTMTPWFKKGIEAGYQSGDLLYLAYSAQDCIIWDPTLDLETASSEQRKYLTIVRDCEYQDSLDSGTLFLQMQLNFQGKTAGLLSMDDRPGEGDFDEEACVAGMRARRFMTGIANYHIYKAEICYLYGAIDEAYTHVLAQDELIASAMSLPQLVRFYIISFLTRAARYPHLPRTEKATTWQRLQADLRQMKRWAEICADNFLHLQRMMEAELARLEGSREQALDGYDAAIEAARASGFRRDEAQANELAGKFLLGAGRPKAAEGYLRAAHYLYYRWGATRKVEQMRESYADLLRVQPARDPAATTSKRTSEASFSDSYATYSGADALDLSSVMKASRAISGELRLEQLWKITLEILLENVGGQRGWFVVREARGLSIAARAVAGEEQAPLLEPVPIDADDDAPRLPASVINTALRTREPVVLQDAAENPRFAADPYIAKVQPKSVLCLPLHRHGHFEPGAPGSAQLGARSFEGAIYIENSLTAGAFSEARVEVVKLLSAQAAISMENAKLYGDQLRLIEAQQRFVPSQFLESLGHPDIASVGLGEHVAKEMSVMFSDLRDFTSLAERQAPGEVIALLNAYFSSQSPPIARAGGFIDAYTGDEIMALFDAPPDGAVRAGIEMQRALEQHNQRAVAEGGPALRAGIGMNTGPLVLGTVGGDDRLKCGVVGDVVNLSSRIEQLTKRYDVPFLIGDGTFRALANVERFSTRMVDRVVVKGKRLAVTLYEVLDAERPERREAKESTRELLGSAHRHLAAREFAEACEVLDQARQLDPDDRVLSLLSERAERYRTSPPTEAWQGFETLLSK